MGRRKRQVEAEQQAGAPEWMVTFSDCMTLLLTFFVLLLSFSSFDERVFRRLKVFFSGALPTVSSEARRDKDAFLAAKQIQYTEELDEGSEKPTLATGAEDSIKEETEPVDFHSRKVFLIPSKKIFWGKGTVISLHGRKILSTMASFLKEVPSRVVIGENGQGDDEDSEQLGLQRAWAVMKYLTKKQGLDKRQFSLSATSTLNAVRRTPNGGYSIPDARPRIENRTLEIVLLERSIYN